MQFMDSGSFMAGDVVNSPNISWCGGKNRAWLLYKIYSIMWEINSISEPELINKYYNEQNAE